MKHGITSLGRRPRFPPKGLAASWKPTGCWRFLGSSWVLLPGTELGLLGLGAWVGKPAPRGCLGDPGEAGAKPLYSRLI